MTLLARSYILRISRVQLAILPCLCCALLCFPSPVAQVPIPDTPAGKILTIFLDAFNNADKAKLEAYVARYDSTNTAENWLAFESMTGGFTLLSIESSAPDAITFLSKGRSNNVTGFASLKLGSIDPPKVKSFSIRALPPGAELDNITLDAAVRQKTIESVSARLTDYYVYPDVAAKMIEAVQQHAKHGDYNAITDGNEFAEALSKDLREVSHDKHLFVDYTPSKSPPEKEDHGPHKPSADDLARWRSQLERENCSFSKVEILPHNIGFVKFGEFARPEFCGATVAAAMGFVAHTDAVIFDMRENHGGDPSMVQLIVSYLFDEPTHINDLLNRHDNETRQYWTLPYVQGPRLIGKPVFVLTSSETFSGAEEFTYDLQTQKRATIVGEVTGGGAHPMNGMSAGDHFMIGVPVGRPVNPITKTDWEGKGITPDVKVPSADALATAQKLAVDKLAVDKIK
jgi:hypothetical protein